MNTEHFFLADITKEVEIPKDGILSRTVYADAQIKVIIFGFDTGQELSKHTASTAAMIHILKGEAHLTLGEASMDVAAGAWAHMPPRLEHAILAKTPLVMLLSIFQ